MTLHKSNIETQTEKTAFVKPYQIDVQETQAGVTRKLTIRGSKIKIACLAARMIQAGWIASR